MGQALQKKKIESSGQNSFDERENRKKYRELLEKAEKLFQKEKFGSAKYHFSEAHQIYPSKELRKRIRTCEENARRMAQAHDLVKQGYSLEREKKIKEALKAFQLSLNAWENKEIRALVAKLQSKLPKPALTPGYQAEADQRYAEAIKRYKEVLELEENPEAKDRIAICLVKQGNYAGAVRLLSRDSEPGGREEEEAGRRGDGEKEGNVPLSPSLQVPQSHYPQGPRSPRPPVPLSPGPQGQDPEVQYYTGYALARLGRYGEALRRWEMIDPDTQELAFQKQKLLEIAVRDLIHRSRLEGEFDQAWQETVSLFASYPALPLVQDYIRSMCLYHLEELWLKEDFKAMLDFCVNRALPAIQDTGIEEFLPFILAKVYYHLAETNAPEYLPDAITFWLTVIHNPKYLIPPGLRKHEGVPASASQDQLTSDLQQKLDQLVQHYRSSVEGFGSSHPFPGLGQKESAQEKTGLGITEQGKAKRGKTEQGKTEQREEVRLKEILAHWDMERKAIDFLVEIAQADLLCTPAFAERFGLSSPILEKLEGVQSLWETDERFWVVGALFSAARRSFLLLNQGKIEEAMAALPAKKEGQFVDYCRQRIFFRMGMGRLQKGEINLKKYFHQAIPLIQRFKEYEKEIIRLAQGIEHDLQKLISMDEVLQLLIHHIRSRELLEITSYIMSYKAHGMYTEGMIKTHDVERICKKALELHPGNEFANEGLREIQSSFIMEELDSALQKPNMKKAAAITINAKNEKVKKAFFDFVYFALDELKAAFLDREKKILLLRDLSLNSQRVDPSHPVLDDISQEIESLEEEA